MATLHPAFGSSENDGDAGAWFRVNKCNRDVSPIGVSRSSIRSEANDFVLQQKLPSTSLAECR